ncbi:unnamed protein product, partial [Rotaria magnacalcarata]
SVNYYSAQLITLNLQSTSIPSPSQLLSPSSMEHCSFEEMDELIRSSSHSVTPAVIDSSKTDQAVRNTTNDSPDIILKKIEDKFQIVFDRLARVERSKSTRTFMNNDSRPASSRSIQIENSTDLRSANLQAQEEISRLKLELAIARSQSNNNQSPSHHHRSSTFKPIPNLVSGNHIHSSHVRTPINIVTSNVIRSSPSPIPITSSSSSLNYSPLVSTPFTMNINNILPNFKGSAEERPVQFLTEFEIRAVSLVGKNDILLLQTVQQALSEGALIWFSQLQRSPDRAHNWKEFKTRFYERYRTPTKVEHLRTELRLLFQRYNESTLDYFERLKTLMVEIDPDCNDQWVKSKFIQKLRPDIRTRFDDDINLSIREVVRKAQAIETSIERQKIDEKLRIAASQENNNSTSFIANNISFDPVIRQRSLPVPTNTISSVQPNIYHHNNDPHPFDNNQTVDITSNCLPINETGCLPNAANNSNCFIPSNDGRNMINYDNQNNYKNNNNNNNNYNDNNAYRYNSKSNNLYYNKNDSIPNYIDNSHLVYHDPHHSYNQNNSVKYNHLNTKSNKNSNRNAVSSC